MKEAVVGDDDDDDDDGDEADPHSSNVVGLDTIRDGVR